MLSTALLLHTLLFLSLLCSTSTADHIRWNHRERARLKKLERAQVERTTTKADAATNVSMVDDVVTVTQRRIAIILGQLNGSSPIASWLSTLGLNGQWPASQIDYTSGCNARRANWPAQTHWSRITTMSAAWHGNLPGAERYFNSTPLRTGISLALGYWFSNDFTNPYCLDNGGLPLCPCGTPGLWSGNWFSNVILIPEFVAQTCLLLASSLTSSEAANCSHMTLRSYNRLNTVINGAGYMTGSNLVDVAKIGLDQGLISENVTLVAEAFEWVHNGVEVQDGVGADGIRPDGSFGQHGGLAYNGGYGKDYLNDDLDLEIEAAGTQFQADPMSMSTFATLVDGDQWMIYRNALTGILHWDFSVLGRFISYPVKDNQATASIQINVTEILVLGQEWGSDDMVNIANALSSGGANANVGPLKGNRMFYDNDYMVHRGEGYVTSVKMFSTRTHNSECSNNQNTMGFHLSDGTVYNYLQGNEYEDIAAAWDWNLIPGTTTDYGATPLTCDKVQYSGLENFVGGVSDTEVGISVMRYTNPYTKALRWQKIWFFLEGDVQVVMVANLSSSSNASVVSVLDQRRHSGDIVLNGQVVGGSSVTLLPGSLYHSGMGYTFDQSVGLSALSVQFGNKTGTWSSIGTSTQPPVNVDMYTAYLTHSFLLSPISYTVYPGIGSYEAFEQKVSNTHVRVIQNNVEVSAVFDDDNGIAMVAFWSLGGGSVTFPGINGTSVAPLTITADGNSAVVYRLGTGNVTVSDPSQTLGRLNVSLSVSSGSGGSVPTVWCSGSGSGGCGLEFVLPTGGLAGSSVSQSITQ